MPTRYRRNVWYQIGGDMNPMDYSGTFARTDGNAIEVLHIDSTIDSVGEREALDVGYPYWTKEACYDDADLRAFLGDDSARRSMNLPEEWTPDMPLTRALRFAIADAAMIYGFRTDGGGGGYGVDVAPRRATYWYGRGREGMKAWRASDSEFRRLLRERDKS
jgi:hypothetical protein